MQGPTPGTGALETYLLNEVGKVPPSSVSESNGVKPGNPVPGDNLGDAIVRVHGQMRQDAATNPTIEIQIAGYGHGPNLRRPLTDSERSQLIRDLFKPGSEISVAQINQGVAVAQPELGSPVPRFLIKRTGYTEATDLDFVGQAEDFYDKGTSWRTYFKPPGGAGDNSNWKPIDIPKLVPDAKSRVLYQVTLTKYVPDEKYDVMVHRWDPATDTEWTFVADVADDDLATLVGRPSLEPQGIGACMARGNLFIFVVGMDGDDAVLLTLRLSGSAVVVDSTNSDIGAGLVRGATGFTSCSAAANDSGFLLVFNVLAYPVAGSEPTRVAQIARSPDGVTWTTNSADPTSVDLQAIGEFARAGGSTPVGRVTSIHFADASVGWAVTDIGEILYSSDGGASWAQQNSPLTVDDRGSVWRRLYGIPTLRCVRAVSSTVAYACGVYGIVLKTTDGGATWKAKRRAPNATTAQLVPEDYLDLAATDTSSKYVPLNALAAASADSVWFVGDGGHVIYTADGGANFLEIQNWQSYKSLTSVTIEASNEILVGGEGGVFARPGLTAQEQAKTTMARIPSAHQSPPGTITYLQVFSDDVIAMQKSPSSSRYTYALSRSGYVWKRTTGDNWKRIHRILHRVSGIYDVLRVLSDTVVMICGRLIERTVDGGDTWVSIEKPFTAAGGIYFHDEDTGVVGGDQQLAYAASLANDRAYSDAFAIPDTPLFLVSCANKTKGLIEAYRVGAPGTPLELVNDAIGFPCSANDALPDNVPQTSITMDEYGQLMLIAGIGRGDNTIERPDQPGASSASNGSGLAPGTYLFVITTRDTTTKRETLPSAVRSVTIGVQSNITLTFAAAGTGRETLIYRTAGDETTLLYLATANAAATSYVATGSGSLTNQGPPESFDGGMVSLDGGSSWVGRQNPALWFPLGRCSTALETSEGMLPLGNSRYVKSFLGRLWSVSVHPDRSGSSTPYIVTSAAREFDGDASPSHGTPIIGIPQYAGVDKLGVEIIGDARPGDTWTIAPDADFPSANLVVESPSAPFVSKDNAADWVIDYDRQSAAAITRLGPGSHFLAINAALFGTNFKDAILRISVPSWNSGTFPTDPNNYVEFRLSAVIATYEGVSAVSGTANIIKLPAGTDLVPDIYKRAAGRCYYLYSDFYGTAYPIEGNTRDSIIIARTAVTSTLGTVRVFGNRMFSPLDAGVKGSTTGISLLDTDYKFTRLVRLIVPVAGNGISGTRREIGTLVIGRTAGRLGPTNKPFERRRGYAAGFGWTPVPSSLEETGPSAVSAVREFGIAQRWMLPYPNLKSWDRDMMLAGFGDELRQAFCLVFDSDRADSAELVRMRDGAEHVHIAGNQFSTAYELAQVL